LLARSAPRPIGVKVDPGVESRAGWSVLDIHRRRGVKLSHANRAERYAVIHAVAVRSGRMDAVRFRIPRRAKLRPNRLVPRPVFRDRREIGRRRVTKIAR
jgi:hypothetical protein